MTSGGWNMGSASAALGARDIIGAPSPGTPRHADTLSGRDISVPTTDQGDPLSAEIIVHTLGEASWHEPVVKRLVELVALTPDWDGYGGSAVGAKVVQHALSILDGVMSDDTVTPAITPTHVGSVLLEWHRGPVSFDIEVLPTRRGIAFFRDRESGEEWETDLGEVQDRLRTIVAKIADLP